ncbi:NAD(P)/FAD-dependent oxidoreductase [Pedobacter steynii]|uniref:Pyridine nucleotide-disulfide oxidoreductase n=1 Tax=Pedobacter steynii TaxID=430522 RepID=A0A1D7QMF8_9SPHI|nr:NAD(P)/FAD-dependent oxidoreductase [Pedobacter steynii]AOM79852.1 pyridine nucleotide-disulfide oxidoreductase [Pedobacter steynii]
MTNPERKIQAITRRKFIVQSTILSSALSISGTLMSFTRFDQESTNRTFDVIIVGGSYSGLSAAMALGRSLRNVLIIDSGLPCNRQTPHSHNFITQDGEKPKDISDLAKKQVLNYKTVSYHQDVAVKMQKKSSLFELSTRSGTVFFAKKVLFATGLKDIMPPIPGFAECWGISIFHCPYCHGYEVKGHKTGILGNGNLAFHYAQLVSNLTSRLSVFTDGKASFSPDQSQSLGKNNIPIVEQPIKSILQHNGQLSDIILQDGTTYPLDALYARPSFEQHCRIPIELGCELTEQHLLKLDRHQQTSVPGIYACGDNSAFRSITTAVSTGSQAGAAINMALSTETFNLK